MSISSILFILVLAAAVGLFVRNVRRLVRNIRLGRDEQRNDHPAERWGVMARVALGQSKMVVRPVAGILHIIVYAGFVIINIEVLEILIDGIFGTHRVFSFLGGFYDFLIGSFEWLALGVWVACVVFLVRRNGIKLKRFVMKELDGWPRTDANLILFTEIALMSAFLLMNAADWSLQQLGDPHYVVAGAYPVSAALTSVFDLTSLSSGTLIAIERSCWWFHIIGILAFLNYLVVSKHLHILLAFPNTWYARLSPKGQMENMPEVQKEVRIMMGLEQPDPNTPAELPEFGANDVFSLGWHNILQAYSCTECGRCTAACPANLTGKKLSPRKIMMDVRDRAEEVGKNIETGKFTRENYNDGKSLFDYISPEELHACTTCNACVEACPVLINPLDIILKMRRHEILTQSAGPSDWLPMFNAIENNGAAWAMSDERDAWKNQF